MGFAVFGENFADFGIQFNVVHFARVLHHFQTAKRHDRAFQRLVCLQADNGFQIFVDVAWSVAGNTGDDLRVDFIRLVCTVFNLDTFHHFRPQFGCGFGCWCQERGIAFIWRVVFLNKIADIYVGFPVATDKTFPSGWTLLNII